MANIIVKNYEHFNRAMGKQIRSRSHYESEMKKGGFVTFEEGCKLAEKKAKEKDWIPSGDCIQMIKEAKALSKNGQIKLSEHPRLVDEMKKKGVSFDKLPEGLPTSGGF